MMIWVFGQFIVAAGAVKISSVDEVSSAAPRGGQSLLPPQSAFQPHYFSFFQSSLLEPANTHAEESSSARGAVCGVCYDEEHRAYMHLGCPGDHHLCQQCANKQEIKDKDECPFCRHTPLHLFDVHLNEIRTVVSSALDQAVCKGNLEAVNKLLEHPRSEVGGEEGKRVLQKALDSHKFRIIRRFVQDNRIDVNVAAAQDKWTALHWAAYYNNVAWAKAMLDHPKINIATINAKTQRRDTALDMALRREAFGVVETLLQDPRTVVRFVLDQAVSEDNLEAGQQIAGTPKN